MLARQVRRQRGLRVLRDHRYGRRRPSRAVRLSQQRRHQPMSRGARSRGAGLLRRALAFERTTSTSHVLRNWFVRASRLGRPLRHSTRTTLSTTAGHRPSRLKAVIRAAARVERSARRLTPPLSRNPLGYPSSRQGGLRAAGDPSRGFPRAFTRALIRNDLCRRGDLNPHALASTRPSS